MASPLALLARSESEPRIALARLTPLRWGAVVGQLFSLLVAAWPLGLALPWLPLLALVAVTVGTNVAAMVWLRLGRPISTRQVGAVLILDVLLLTGLLFLSGGSSNPFGVLYLVHVTLAAIVLPAVGSLAIVALALACYGLLFFSHVPIPELEHAHHGDARAFSLHLQGMWVANAVAAALIAWFTTQLRRSLRSREEELEKSRLLSNRYERLAAVGTLATGAAHELGTPLGTIAVAARELERHAADEDVRGDAQLIREQVDRCQSILRQLREQAAAPGGEELRPAPLSTILDEVTAALSEERRQRLLVSCPEALRAHPLPRGVVMRTLRDLLHNAFDASAPEGRVHLSVAAVGDALELTVLDEGVGMSADVLERAFEPFFTTKEPGRGTGLGLHLGRSIAVQLGGELSLESSPGEGTRAVLRLARAA